MKFRASYSILNSWSKGYAEDAIAMYFKLEREPNKYMIDGLRHHKSWESYILKNKKLHPQLSSLNKTLTNPQCELKLEMPINEYIDFVGVIDCLDEDTLYEFKTGIKHSSDYANTYQADLYSVLLKHHGYTPEKAIYIHFDQYSKETDSAMVWLTDKRRENALEWLVKTATEMNEYLQSNGLYEKYNKPEIIQEVLIVDEIK